MVASIINSSHDRDIEAPVAPILEDIGNILGKLYTPEIEASLKKISTPVLQKFYEFMESERLRRHSEFMRRISDLLSSVTK
jgi:hypothetical protein